MIYKNILIFCLTSFVSSNLSSQTYCDTTVKNLVFERIFGGEDWAAHQTDTIITAENQKVIYQCSLCELSGYDKHNKKIWTNSLNNNNCSFTTFVLFDCIYGNRIKNCDIILQVKDKSTYGLRSKTGKMVILSERTLQKNKKNAHFGRKQITSKSNF